MAIGEQLPAIDEPLLAALADRGFNPLVAGTPAEARDLVLALLPQGALISAGSSTTLQQIGVTDVLASSGEIRYGNAEWLAEEDAQKRLELRKRNSIFADVYLGSVQAITRSGQVIGCDMSGSRQGPYVWGPKKLIWIAGANKIVDDLDAAFERIYQEVLPLEDARIRALGGAGSSVNKLVVYEREPVGDRTTIVLVSAKLGF